MDKILNSYLTKLGGGDDLYMTLSDKPNTCTEADFSKIKAERDAISREIAKLNSEIDALPASDKARRRELEVQQATYERKKSVKDRVLAAETAKADAMLAKLTELRGRSSGLVGFKTSYEEDFKDATGNPLPTINGGSYSNNLHNDMINILNNYKKMLGGENSLYVNISDNLLDCDVENNKKNVDAENLEITRRAKEIRTSQGTADISGQVSATDTAKSIHDSATAEIKAQTERKQRYRNIFKSLQETDKVKRRGTGALASTGIGNNPRYQTPADVDVFNK
jgi:hypothetical protein